MMMPLTIIVDRQFRGVGRIKRASGTTSQKVVDKINEILTELYDDGRIDLLRAIRDGHITLLEVRDAHRRRKLDALATGATVRPLIKAMRDWSEAMECSDKHRISLGTSIAYLEAASPKATINDAPRVVEGLRKTLGGRHARSFNLARSAVLAFLRDTVKQSHPLWNAVRDVSPRKVVKRAPRPDLTPDWMREMFPNPGTDATDAIAWGMATTGMGAGESWGRWDVRADRVRIFGTKREARVRDVPLTMVPLAPRLHHRTFEDHVRDRTDRKVQPYDLRRCFARWMESAGITRARRIAYMGHAAGDITSLYERHEISAYLVADAEKMRAFVGVPEAAAQLKLVEAK
jgi:hypothetical protein